MSTQDDPAPRYIPPPPQAPSAPTASGKTNGLAIAALVCGLIPCGPTFIAAIIMGHIALVQIKREKQGGRGLAIAGCVLGYCWLAIVILGAIGKSMSNN